MKFAAVLLAAVFAVGAIQAQTKPAPKPGEAKPGVKQEEEMGVIEGTTLTRPNGHFLGLTLQDGKYKLTF
jgi:hypothetical protein